MTDMPSADVETDVAVSKAMLRFHQRNETLLRERITLLEEVLRYIMSAHGEQLHDAFDQAEKALVGVEATPLLGALTPLGEKLKIEDIERWLEREALPYEIIPLGSSLSALRTVFAAMGEDDPLAASQAAPVHYLKRGHCRFCENTFEHADDCAWKIAHDAILKATNPLRS
jgi:hypothetical protein